LVLAALVGIVFRQTGPLVELHRLAHCFLQQEAAVPLRLLLTAQVGRQLVELLEIQMLEDLGTRPQREVLVWFRGILFSHHKHGLLPLLIPPVRLALYFPTVQKVTVDIAALSLLNGWDDEKSSYFSNTTLYELRRSAC
jgi:hypothetical protein